MLIHRKAYFLHTNIQQRISHIDFLNSKWNTSSKCSWEFLVTYARHKYTFPSTRENVSHIHKESKPTCCTVFFFFIFLVRYPQVSTRYSDHLQVVISSDASTWNYFTPDTKNYYVRRKNRKHNFTLYLISPLSNCILIIFQLCFNYNLILKILIIVNTTTVVTTRDNSKFKHSCIRRPKVGQ